MKSSARIDSAVFQLTPTRTRCDLVILANGRAEKIATGLLNPFLAHLKAARDQMAVGGYSIELKPEPGSGALWFTKGTLERFVRFVSTPEILERVDTLESEILQIDEAIAMQSNKNGGIPGVDEHHGKLVKNVEAVKPVLNSDEDKAIVLYKPDSQYVEANGSTVQDGNSKVDLLKILETRRNALRKEQGMAFARAVAAGFEIDIMDTLISFAQCFGATRLMGACKRFIDLWKKKHESGQWLEIEVAETRSSQSDFMAMNASGIVLTDASNQQMSTSEKGEKSPMDQQVPADHHENFQGQYPHPLFPPWQFQPPPGAPPGYQPYPTAPMPYYPNYPANGPYFQPVFSPVTDQRSKCRHKSRQKWSSHNAKESTSESEDSGKDSDANYSTESDEEKETKMQRKKHGSSGKKKSGMVVIRNINYISSKEENGSDGETNSASGPGKGDDEARTGTLARNENLLLDKNEASYNNEIDGGHWKAFQNFLLKDSEEDSAANKGIFSMEKGAKIKRRPNGTIDDPLAVGGGDVGQYVEDDVDNQQMSGSAMYRRRASSDEMLISRTGDRQSNRGSLNAHPSGVNGRSSAYRRTDTDDFMVQGRDGISSFSPSDLSLENRYKTVPRGSNSRSSYNATDDGYIVSLRSNSFETEGTVLGIHSEFPFGSLQTDKATKKAQASYEPDYTSVMPGRETDRGLSSYDLAIDYEMQARRPKGSTPNKSERAVAAKNQGPKKEAKDQKMKLTRDAARTTGPIRKDKPTRSSPLDEARARAERMRSYKADLQKVKKEKEDEQSKRLEALKIERQKRIAARSSSVPRQSSSLLARKNLPNKLSPSPKPSKFTDAGQSSSSSLQRSSKRTIQVGTNQSEKVLTATRLSTVKQSGGARLSRLVPSLNEELKGNSIIKSDAKTSMARIRRLSEPKMTSRGVAPLVKPQNMEAARQQISRASDGKQISAIISLDESKAASLPELKIRTYKPSDAKSVLTVSGNKRDNTRGSDADDCTVVEKTVLMLEHEKPYTTSSSASQDKDHLPKKHRDGDIRTEKQDPLLYNVNQPSSNVPSVVKSDAIKVAEQVRDHQAKTYNLECAPGSMITRSSEKPYQAPYSRSSSLEDPCTANSEYCKALPTFRSTTKEGPESVKVHLTDSNSMGKKKLPETVEKQQESSSKGFRKLWNFSRKSSDSASSERVGEPDYVSVGKSDADNHASHTGPSNEAYTLKNLIYQDETPTAATIPKKSSRPFSLLSPFRSKSEKKNMV